MWLVLFLQCGVYVMTNNNRMKALKCKTLGACMACITKYGSTLYIGMDEVLAHYACTFEYLDLHFHFQ